MSCSSCTWKVVLTPPAAAYCPCTYTRLLICSLKHAGWIPAPCSLSGAQLQTPFLLNLILVLVKGTHCGNTWVG